MGVLQFGALSSGGVGFNMKYLRPESFGWWDSGQVGLDC